MLSGLELLVVVLLGQFDEIIRPREIADVIDLSFGPLLQEFLEVV